MVITVQRLLIGKTLKLGHILPAWRCHLTSLYVLYRYPIKKYISQAELLKLEYVIIARSSYLRDVESNLYYHEKGLMLPWWNTEIMTCVSWLLKSSIIYIWKLPIQAVLRFHSDIISGINRKACMTTRQLFELITYRPAIKLA